MKNTVIILMGVVLSGLLACTKQKVIDTGTPSAHFEGTILQYLKSDSYNWALTVEMIERAGLTDAFEGKVDTLKEITFLGPTSFSILRYLYDHDMETVSELSPAFCREMILKHVVKGKYLKEDVKLRDMQYYIYDTGQTGYTGFTSLGGNVLRAYLEKTSWQDIPGAGPVNMYLYSMTIGMQVPLASPNIQPSNGVVHSLNYNYILGNL